MAKSSDPRERRFREYVDRVAQAVGHRDRHEPLRAYLTGLCLPRERKSVEPMAARIDPRHVRARHQSMHPPGCQRPVGGRGDAPDRARPGPDGDGPLSGRLADTRQAAGVVVGAGADDKLAEMRRMYEPSVTALSEYLLMPLPVWRAGGAPHENWRSSPWGKTRGLPSDAPDH